MVTPSLQLRMNVPKTEETKKKLTECIDFLQYSHRLGTCTLLWSCPISLKFVGFTIERHERPAGDYYREPYPITLQIISPEVPGLPQCVFPLTDSHKEELLSALEIELKSKWSLGTYS